MRYGIRELKDGDLSRAVKQASQGEDVVITEHGRPVARIVPYAERQLPPNAAELVARGLLVLRTPRLDGIRAVKLAPGPKSSVDYIREQRR